MVEARLLVTPEDLRTYDYARRVKEAGPQSPFSVAVLSAAQDGLRRYLGYDPLVHLVRRHRPRWRLSCGDGVPHEAFGAGTGPIAAVDASPYGPAGSAEDYYTISASADGALLEVEPEHTLPYVVDLYEGWRGARHVVTADGEETPAGMVDLRAIDGLSGLTALPPVVPDGLVTAICEAAVFIAVRPAHVGVDATEIDIGANVKRSESAPALNDVNRLVGRSSELTAIYAQYASSYRRINA